MLLDGPLAVSPTATVEIEIPSRSAYVAVVRLALSALARAAGLNEELVDDLKIAVSEACANAVLANEQANPGAPVTVRWTESPAELAVEVGDRGNWHDSSGDDAVDSQGFSTRFVMSFALLQSLVDDCSLTAREGGGTCARLAFAR